MPAHAATNATKCAAYDVNFFMHNLHCECNKKSIIMQLYPVCTC